MNDRHAPRPALAALPEETLLSVAPYLSVPDVRSLASTCRAVRSTLVASQGAKAVLWTRRMAASFPIVFQRALDRADATTEAEDPIEVSFVDYYQLPVQGLSEPTSGEDVNLPLLTSLLPQRYPRSIDPATLQYQVGDVRDASTRVQEARFLGPVVGVGDHCIRSDEPFPAMCHASSPPSSSAPTSRLIGWTKNLESAPPPSRRQAPLFQFLSSLSPTSSTGTSGMDAPSSTAGAWEFPKKAGKISRRSTVETVASDADMEELSSSLEETWGDAASSENDETSTLLPPMVPRESSVVGTNRRHGLMQRLGKLCPRTKPRNNNFRPFVIPIVLSESRTTKGAKPQLIIDVTPRTVVYYEVNIAGRAESVSASSKTRGENEHHRIVAVGLSTQSFRTQENLPGWDDASYGYHGDDGRFFHRGRAAPQTESSLTFGPGDTVGCGLEYHTRRIFFTLNGKFGRYAFDKVKKDDIEKGLYPTVGVDSNYPICVNLGQRPFKFDVVEFAAV